MVRMTTLTGSATSAPASRRVASMPSTRGMRTSMSTTSACSRRATVTASSPSAASPTTTRSGWASTIMANPLRTSSWSSATTTRTGARRRPSRRQREAAPVDGEAAVGRRAGLEAATEDGHPLPHPHESLPPPPPSVAPERTAARAPAVVGHA